jgi:hypothetical protein
MSLNNNSAWVAVVLCPPTARGCRARRNNKSVDILQILPSSVSSCQYRDTVLQMVAVPRRCCCCSIGGIPILLDWWWERVRLLRRIRIHRNNSVDVRMIENRSSSSCCIVLPRRIDWEIRLVDTIPVLLGTITVLLLPFDALRRGGNNREAKLLWSIIIIVKSSLCCNRQQEIVTIITTTCTRIAQPWATVEDEYYCTSRSSSDDSRAPLGSVQ